MRRPTDTISHEEHMERLLASIYPSRIEMVLVGFVRWAYTHPPQSIWDRIGDRADNLLVRSHHRRARRNYRRKFTRAARRDAP